MRKKSYQKEYIINGQSKTCWTVDEVLDQLKKHKRYNTENNYHLDGTESVEVYPKINDCGHMMWHLEVYRYNEVKSNNQK